MKPWCSASPAERHVLEGLLVVEFPGRDALRLQLDDLQVRAIDQDGSLELKRQTGPLAQVSSRLAVNGRYFDRETGDEFSPAVNLLLHVIDGRMAELEVYKDDGSEIVVSPFEIDPGRLEVY